MGSMHLFDENYFDQKVLYFIRPLIWNKIPEISVKQSVNTSIANRKNFI